MSEYQYVEFRAVDRPLTDAELDFARRQSTRADISRWSLRNEYHYGDFRGDVKGLLRRGYDVFLHYANFGVRIAAFRLPAGFPFPKAVWQPYLSTAALTWEPDRTGDAGILSIRPDLESGDLEDLWNPHECIGGLAEVRNRLIAGDLRVLYALWLCAAAVDQSMECDVIEPPVPGGLSECAGVLEPLLKFFGLDPLLLRAASEGAPDAPQRQTDDQLCRAWLKRLSDSESKRLLRRFLTEDANAIKAETIAAMRQRDGSPDWPTAALRRSLQMLLDRTEQLRADHDAKAQKEREAAARREAAKQERERQRRMQEMVKEPETWLHKATELVEARGTDNYQAAAEILADLREAIGGEDGESIVRRHAVHLARKHPTLNRLKSSLRRCGLLE